MDAILFKELLENPGRLSEGQLLELEKISRDHPYCKSAMILYLAGLYHLDIKNFENQLKRTFIHGNDKRLLQWVIDSLGEEKEEKPKPLDEEYDKLIDKFIKDEPSISKPAGDYKQNIEIAHRSSLDNDEITSETLAQIHLNQGNKKRAIEIYKQLSLKNPEKSRYFAALIEKLNTNSN